MMEAFFFWAGVFAVSFAAGVSLFFSVDWLIEKVVDSFGFKKLFVQFIWDYYRNRSHRGN